MRIERCLFVAALALSLSVPAAEAKDKSNSKPTGTRSGRATTEKDFKRGTEGHQPHDLNGDGQITRNEWPGNDTSYRQMDTNGDGVLTKKDRGYDARGIAPSLHESPRHAEKKGSHK